MNRFTSAATVAALAVALTACASGPGGGGRGPAFGRFSANPSAVIAAELGFARLAQDKGQWTAFRATASEDALIFTPQRNKAADYLEDKDDPLVSVRWQPHQVWSSCDGSYGVTRGAWQGSKGTGYFSTVWQRQKDGRYKWVVDQGGALVQPLTAPESIKATVADCSTDRPPPIPPLANLPEGEISRVLADDGSLEWTSATSPRGATRFILRLWDGKAFVTAIDVTEPPPATP